MVPLAPIVLVCAVIVVACFGNAYLKEIRVSEHRPCGGKSSTGVSVYSRTVKLDPGILPGKLFHACYLIWQGVVSQIAIVCVLKFLGSQRISHPIQFDYDKPE